MHSIAARALAATLLVTGCIQGGPTPEADPPAFTRFGYVCPEDEGAPGDVAYVSHLSDPQATLEEPFVAVHPSGPSVWAVGVNYGMSAAENAEAALADGPLRGRLALFVTEDAGKSWRKSLAPRLLGADPAFVFDADGRIHLTGLSLARKPEELASAVLTNEGDSGSRVWYTVSEDLGVSWSDPVVLSDSDPFQDRNWIIRDAATGRLYVIWQNVGGEPGRPVEKRTVEIAWSEDGGATWKTQQPGDFANCHRAGVPVMQGQQLLFACTTRTKEADVEVHAFAPEAGRSVLKAVIPGPGHFPSVHALADGRLALVADACFPPDPCGTDSRVFWSADGDEQWQEGPSVGSMIGGDWNGVTRAYWTAADPWGGLHLVVKLEAREPSSTPFGEPKRTYAVHHVVLDTSGELVQETPLASWSTTDPPDPRASPLERGDHYYGMAWSGNRALAAFTTYPDVSLTVVAPLTSS